jgi:hypothetical protein
MIAKRSRESARNQLWFSRRERAVDTAGAEDMFEDFDRESHPGVHFLPPVDGGSPCDTAVDEPGLDNPVARLREDLRTLAEQVNAIDRRDAAQHGGLKGEIAHLVRRIARLEAIPRPRPVR